MAPNGTSVQVDVHLAKVARKDPSTLTRAEVGRFLGCSRRRVQQLQMEGRLRSVVDAQGWHVFSRIEVIAFAEKRGRTGADKTHGTVAAEVFRLFREGVELPEVVMQTKQAPATVRALWEEYRRPLEVPAALPDLPLGGLRNEGLFATHHLQSNVTMRDDWKSAGESARQVLPLRDEELLRELGYEIERGPSPYVVLRHGESKVGLALS